MSEHRDDHPTDDQADADDAGTSAEKSAGGPMDGPSHGSDAEARLAAVLRDLETLRQYLEQRGRHTYTLAQRFLANAARDPTSRAYDERQATMLEYQHYIWHEIADRVAQLIAAHGEPMDDRPGQD